MLTKLCHLTLRIKLKQNVNHHKTKNEQRMKKKECLTNDHPQIICQIQQRDIFIGRWCEIVTHTRQEVKRRACRGHHKNPHPEISWLNAAWQNSCHWSRKQRKTYNIRLILKENFCKDEVCWLKCFNAMVCNLYMCQLL